MRYLLISSILINFFEYFYLDIHINIYGGIYEQESSTRNDTPWNDVVGFHFTSSPVFWSMETTSIVSNVSIRRSCRIRCLLELVLGYWMFDCSNHMVVVEQTYSSTHLIFFFIFFLRLHPLLTYRSFTEQMLYNLPV